MEDRFEKRLELSLINKKLELVLLNLLSFFALILHVWLRNKKIVRKYDETITGKLTI